MIHRPHIHPHHRRRTGGLQQERTALAWERTAFALMGAGLVLARFTALHDQGVLAVAALAVVALGAGLLVWAGSHYEDRLDLVHHGRDVVHPGAARYAGLLAVLVSGLCLTAGIVAVATGSA